jgi:hypothetical protein
MKFSHFPLLILLLFLIQACSEHAEPIQPDFDPDPIKLEDVDRLIFAGPLRTEESVWQLSENGFRASALFDKSAFPKAWRATFATTIRTSEIGNKAYAQLYNMTDSVVIAGSELYSDTQYFSWVETADILKHLPDKPVLLAVRIRSEKKGFWVSTRFNSYLSIFSDPS